MHWSMHGVFFVVVVFFLFCFVLFCFVFLNFYIARVHKFNDKFATGMWLKDN